VLRDIPYPENTYRASQAIAPGILLGPQRELRSNPFSIAYSAGDEELVKMIKDAIQSLSARYPRATARVQYDAPQIILSSLLGKDAWAAYNPGDLHSNAQIHLNRDLIKALPPDKQYKAVVMALTHEGTHSTQKRRMGRAKFSSYSAEEGLEKQAMQAMQTAWKANQRAGGMGKAAKAVTAARAAKIGLPAIALLAALGAYMSGEETV
jgi:hypothetical protein